jgi:phosphoribosylaminoimidazole-succinocarboxamide synthase
MIFARQPPIGRLDYLVLGLWVHLKDFIVIRHRHNRLLLFPAWLSSPRCTASVRICYRCLSIAEQTASGNTAQPLSSGLAKIYYTKHDSADQKDAHMEQPTLLQTKLPLPAISTGPVYETYDLGDQLLVVATDRLALVDAILPNGIPWRGQTLNSLSLYWYKETAALLPNYLLTTDLNNLPTNLRPHEPQLAGRSMLVKKTHRLSFSCLVRGYLTAPAWQEYQKSGSLGDHPLPAGLRKAEQLPEPIVTPLLRAPDGQRTPTTLDDLKNHLGEDQGEALAQISRDIYSFAAQSALDRGIIIADTRLSFGLLGHQLLLIDELLTPDSSRFWAVGDYAPGTMPPSFDKQLVMEYLEQQRWRKGMPVPKLPPEVVQGTAQRYRELLLWLTGSEPGATI